MFIIYDLFFLLFALFYFPYTLLTGKVHRGFWLRLGIIPTALKKELAAKPNIWFHAVSVGEVIAVAGLIKETKVRYPGHRIILSTVTQTGYRVAKERLAADDLVLFAPFDLSFITRCWVELAAPRIYITAETEIWPNVFLALSRRGIPIVVVNGRISDRSAMRYRKVSWLLLPALKRVRAFCMQTPLDVKRIQALGVSPSQVQVTGNMKFDFPPEPRAFERSELGLQPEDILLIAGSTHPGEEGAMLRIFRELKKEFPRLRLLLAPRHIERAGRIVTEVKAAGFVPQLFSQRKAQPVIGDEVWILDTIGQLRGLYRLADLVFVGKSLLGRGGQNIVEPAFFAKPVLVGPHMENFRNIMEMFLTAQAVVQADSPEELSRHLRRLLAHPQERQEMGARAEQVVRQCQGAVAKNLQVILALYPPSSPVK